MKGVGMFARVSISQTPPDNVDLAIKVINEDVIPAAKKIPGFKGGYWLGDRMTGKGVVVTLFEDEAAMKESEEATKKIRSEAVSKIGATIVSIDRYEVLGQA